MPECSNHRTSERAQLLAAMTHPSRVLNLDVNIYIEYLRILGDQEVSKSQIFVNTLLFAQCECSLSENIFFSAVAGLTAAKGLALAFQANDPHTNAFTLAILRLHESLYLANLKRKWWKTGCPKEPNSSK